MLIKSNSNALHNDAFHKLCNPMHCTTIFIKIPIRCTRFLLNYNALKYANHMQNNPNALHKYAFLSNAIPMHCTRCLFNYIALFIISNAIEMHCTTKQFNSNALLSVLHNCADRKQCNPNALLNYAYHKQCNSNALHCKILLIHKQFNFIALLI